MDKSKRSSVLVVDDDVVICDVLREALVGDGFEVFLAHEGTQAVKLARAENPSLILMDVVMPGMDGLEACRALRSDQETSMIPIIMLSGRGEEMDVVFGLDQGADDYLAKPFRLRELLARVHAALRRKMTAASVPPSAEPTCPVRVDLERHEAYLREAPLPLTHAEFRLLWHLRQNPGKVFSRRDLLTVINGAPQRIEANIDVHMSSLRKKLGKDGRWLVTVRGVGYKLRAA